MNTLKFQLHQILYNSYQKLFPKYCVLCGFKSDTELELCQVCNQALPWLQDACYQCGAILEQGKESIRCRDCIISPPAFDRLCALFNYEMPISKLMPQLKFHDKLLYGKLLGQLLLQEYPKWYGLELEPEALLPVPLADGRLRQRGFNQVLEILRPIMQTKKFPILSDHCVRVKSTKPQTKMSMRYRRRNLRGAFKMMQRIPYRHIAVVDDVYTTGSTIQAISEVLRKVGVEQIDVWCIFRTQSLRGRKF